jgi:hypothetical protein
MKCFEMLSSQTIILKGGRPSVRTPFFGPARPNRPAFLRLPTYLSKYLPLPCSPIACGCACARCSAVAVFPAVHPISRRAAPPSSAASHAAPPLSPRHAPSPAVLALVRCASCPRCLAPCPVPHARRGADEVPPPPFPTKRSWSLSCRGRRDARPQRGYVAIKVHVASLCFKCFRRFRCTL